MKFKSFALIALALIPLLLNSCMRPYDTPEFIDVASNETAFVFAVEGDASNQVQFASAAELEKLQVEARRIQIPHRWQKTDRGYSSGVYLPLAKVIKVDRQPVSRTWGSKNSGSNKGADDAIQIESKDSVGFASGWTCTAEIRKADASKFLFQYPGSALYTVMDNEIHDRVQTRAAQFAALHDLDGLRAMKGAMLVYVRDGEPVPDDADEKTKLGKMGVVDYFKLKGITITNIGMFEGFRYDNPEIQKSIDNVFRAQQDKQVALAEKEAQTERNNVIALAATAEADKMTTLAKAKASAIEMETVALTKASSVPLFAQKLLLEKWNGAYPQFFSGGIGSEPALLLNVPNLVGAKQ